MKTKAILTWLASFVLTVFVMMPHQASATNNNAFSTNKKPSEKTDFSGLHFTAQALKYSQLISAPDRDFLVRNKTLSVYKPVDILASEYYIPFLLVKTGQQRIVFNCQENTINISSIETFPLDNNTDFIKKSLSLNGIFFGCFLLSFLIFFSWIDHNTDINRMVILGGGFCCLVYWMGLDQGFEDLGKVFSLIIPLIIWLALAIFLAAKIHSARIKPIFFKRQHGLA